jgi:hypothetical protein
MKKIILLAVVAVAVTSASCRKERTCTCSWTNTSTTTFGGASTTSSSTGSDKWTFNELKKRDARVWAECTDHTDTYNYSGGSGSSAYTTVSVTENTCELD